MQIHSDLWKRRGYVMPALVLCLAFFFFSIYAYADEDYAVTGVQMQGLVTSSSSLNVRSGPGTDYDVITTVDNGMTLAITGETETGGMTWYQVEANGKTGFVRSDYVEAVPISEGETDQEELDEEAGEPEMGYESFYQRPIFKKLVLIVAAILVVLTMLVLTLKGLRKDADNDADDSDDYEDEDAYEDEEAYADDDGYEEAYTDEADEDLYEDAYADDTDADPYENEAAYADGSYGDDELYEDGEPEAGYADREAFSTEYDRDGQGQKRRIARQGRMEQPAKQERRGDRKAYILREEDYRVQIDPSFFEDREPIEQPAMVTGYLEKKLIEEAARAHEVEMRDEELHQAGGDPEDKQKELDQAMAKLNELQKEIERLKSQT